MQSGSRHAGELRMLGPDYSPLVLQFVPGRTPGSFCPLRLTEYRIHCIESSVALEHGGFHPHKRSHVSHPTLQEVIGRINRASSRGKDQRTEDNRTPDQPHCPVFYVPRMVRLLAHITLNTRA